MKPRPELKLLTNGKYVDSINLLRLRVRLRQIAPGHTEPPRMLSRQRIRRAAIRARTGGFCRG